LLIPLFRQARYHFNPQIHLKIASGITPGGKLVWILTNHRNINAATTVLTYLSPELNPIVISEEAIHNTSYRESYFNTLSAIWRRAQQHAETNEILMHDEESAYRALTNYLNRDYPVIKLREEIAKNNITIRPIDKTTMGRITEKLKSNKPTKIVTIGVNWPNAELQKEANWRTNALHQHKINELTMYLTSTMRNLCGVALAWASVPVDKLNNQTLIMLTGLVTDKRKSLTHGEIKQDQPSESTKYPGCDCIVSEHNATNTLKHRITICPKYYEIRKSIFQDTTGVDNI